MEYVISGGAFLTMSLSPCVHIHPSWWESGRGVMQWSQRRGGWTGSLNGARQRCYRCYRYVLWFSSLSIPSDGHSRSGLVGPHIFKMCWECFNLLDCNNQFSKIALQKTNKKYLTSFVNVVILSNVAPLLGDTYTLNETFSASPIPPWSSAQEISLNNFLNISLANDAAAIHVQVQNGSWDILQGVFK